MGFVSHLDDDYDRMIDRCHQLESEFSAGSDVSNKTRKLLLACGNQLKNIRELIEIANSLDIETAVEVRRIRVDNARLRGAVDGIARDNSRLEKMIHQVVADREELKWD
jgi:hypothetical protein